MSCAIAVPRLQFGASDDYEPVSDGSQILSGLIDGVRNVLRGTAADWLPTALASLEEIRATCRRVAHAPVDGSVNIEGALDNAEQVLERLFVLLPKGTPAPDLIPEEDGELCISWSVGSGQVFALSVGAHDKINFAGQFGKRGGVHAWQPIDRSSPSALDASLQEAVCHVAKLYATSFGRHTTR